MSTDRHVNERGGDVLDRLRVTVHEVKLAYATLEDLVQHPSTRPADVVVTRSAMTGSSPAWNSQAAYLVLELGQQARGLEEGLRDRVTGTVQARGGSDRNTFLALDAVVELAHAVVVNDAADVERALNRWLYAAKTCLGEVEPWTRLPRLLGQAEPRCPWCHFTTLRYQRYAGIVKCVNPECADDDGRHPKGTVDLGPYSGEPILAWGDGSTGLEGVAA